MSALPLIATITAYFGMFQDSRLFDDCRHVPRLCNHLQRSFNSSVIVACNAMIDKRPNLQGEEPRSEPEIIPPGPAKRGTTRMGDSIDAHVGRVYIAKFGPLGTILLTLVVGLLTAVLIVLLFGALLVALPAIELLVTAAIVAGLLRVYFRAP